MGKHKMAIKVREEERRGIEQDMGEDIGEGRVS